MSAAKKFWIGVAIFLTLIVGIKSPYTILIVAFIYFIVSTIGYIAMVFLEDEDAEDAEDYILSKYSLPNLLVISIRKFNNFLNTKFNKDE
mgnify:CR=1 FL=1